jgi:hypothetical protein
MSRRKSTAPPIPTPDKRKEKSRFPFRRGDSSRSFQEVDSPPPISGQGLTPVGSQDQEPPALPQPRFTRGETNGLTSADDAPNGPRTNGNNFMDAPITRSMDQPLPQVSQLSLQGEMLLISQTDTPRAQRCSCVSIVSSGCLRTPGTLNECNDRRPRRSQNCKRVGTDEVYIRS